MKLVDASIKSPVSVTVGVLLVALFGMLALLRIPVQLIPDVEVPQAVVTTIWPGASPEEIETEIVQKQEEQLKSLEGLVKMTSQSSQSTGTVTLQFQIGVEPDALLPKVSNRLQQVPQYPATALKPVITSKSPFAQNVIAWIVLQALPDSDVDIERQRDFAIEVVQRTLERVPGVAVAQIVAGRDRELQVTVDPQKLAVRGLSLSQVAAALDAENRDISAGDFDEGKRTYVVRTVGEYTSPEQIEDVVLAWRAGGPIYTRDVATVELGYAKQTAIMRQRGLPTIGVAVQQQSGSNTLVVLDGVERAVAQLNSGSVGERGMRLVIVFSQGEYIESAISLVQRNIFIGGLLALMVLLLFLRSFSSTLVIGLAIPVSVVATFLVMSLLGRNINVVSLAGMAFAVGMIVDASIVVLENIYRHQQMGKRRAQAAYDGTVEVWGAVFASVMTTVAVFLPVLFVQEEAGQLFRDIAVAVSAAVLISLVVSVTLIPSLSARILGRSAAAGGAVPEAPQGRPGIMEWGARLNRGIADFTYWLSGSVVLRLVVVLVLAGGAVIMAWSLMPETEYLPNGNLNFAFGLLIPPPGYNIDEFLSMSETVSEVLRPYRDALPGSPEAARLDAPPIENDFFASTGFGAFMGVIGYQSYGQRTGELVPVLQQALGLIPGTFGVVQQPSIFQRGPSAGRAIDVDLTGPDLNVLLALGGRVFGSVMATLPGAQAQPIPGLDLGNPEVRIIPDRERAAELGMTASELGFALNALVDGVKISEYQFEGRAIDLMLKGATPYATRSQDIEALNIATPSGRVVSVGDVGRVVETNGPTQINRIERQRAVTIRVLPDREMPLEAAMATIEDSILGPMRADGSLSLPYEAALSGSADKLTTTRQALQGNMFLALVVTYLLMAALFESFLYPFVILFSVPFAALGGFVGLAMVNRFIAYQALDVIAMLGFVILVGIVVNSAILIVHQTLNYMRDRELEHREALRDAVSDRVRPIFMSTLTSVVGMAPLVLVTGPGSEIYRGLGSVVVGGLVVSTIFTLFLVPAVFSIVMDVRAAVLRAVRGSDEARVRA
jgi:HAE1 family hydrophobic/amphiphilic exporter-1